MTGFSRASVAFGFFLHRWSLRAVTMLATLVLLCACSGSDAPSMPTDDQARAIFERLHRGIYAAFDADDESAVYDALSASVAGDLLEDIYIQVYQSLIAREHGGVVSEIIAVTPLSMERLNSESGADSQAPAFDVRASWEVNSIAEHEGHRHLRANQYEAIYRVAWLQDDWRIVADRMLRQRRVGEAWQENVGAATGDGS